MYEVTVLPNGVPIISEHIPYVRSVSIGFWWHTGSRHEVDRLCGASHFIEHMLFKGTTNRSARDIAEAIDFAGGQLNAFTSKEHTCYYARVLDEHLDLAVDIISDMMLNSCFASDELEKERAVILEEIRMCEDTPDEIVHDLFIASALAGHPLAHSILGTEDTVCAIHRDDLLAYMQQRYHAGNLVIAAAGNVPHAEIVRAVTERLATLQSQTTPDNYQEAHKMGADIFKNKDTEQVHLCMGGLGIQRNSPEIYALHILDMALGGGMSSRLFQELREKRGLVYATYSYHTLFQDAGIFSVYAGTSPRNVRKVVRVIRQQFADVCAHGLHPDEIKRAKEQLKGSLMLSLENTVNRMSRLAKMQLFSEEMLTPDELVTRIEKVTSSEVQAVAKTLLQRANQVITAVGPVNQQMLEEE